MKSMSLNPFSVTDLRPEVELIHFYCACAYISVMFETDVIAQTPSSLERYLVSESDNSLFSIEDHSLHGSAELL